MKKLIVARLTLIVLCTASFFVCWHHTHPIVLNLAAPKDTQEWVRHAFKEIANQSDFQAVIGLKTDTMVSPEPAKPADPANKGVKLPFDCIVVSVENTSPLVVSGAGMICAPIEPVDSIYALTENQTQKIAEKLSYMYLDGLGYGMEKSCQRPELKQKCAAAADRMMTDVTPTALTALIVSGLWLALAEQADAAMARSLRFSAAAFLTLLALISWQITGFVWLHTGSPWRRAKLGLLDYLGGASLAEARREFCRERQAEQERARIKLLMTRQAEDYGITQLIARRLAVDDLDGARALIREKELDWIQKKKDEEAKRQEREARDLFLAAADRFGSDVRRQATALYDAGKQNDVQDLIAREEEKLYRRNQLETYQARINACPNELSKRSAQELLDSASRLLEVKGHVWRRQIYEIQQALEGKLSL